MRANPKTARSFDDLPKDYRSLCMEYLPHPIHTNGESKEAWIIIYPMMGREDDMTADQSEYMRVIADFIADFEDKDIEDPVVSPSKMLSFLMDQHSMTASDIGRLLGVDRSQGARIVNGTRNLTVTQISKLSERFGVEPGAFNENLQLPPAVIVVRHEWPHDQVHHE